MDSNHRFTDFKSVDSSAGLHAHLKLFKEPSLTTLSSYHILLTCQTSFSEKWWVWPDLNQHGFLHGFLRAAWLPLHHIPIKFGSPGGDCTHDLTLIRSVL